MSFEPLQQLLVEKVDNLVLVRDQIANILMLESANQQELAAAEGLDPELAKLRVFVERGNCWGEFTSDDDGVDDATAPAIIRTPVVSVWTGSAKYDKKRSDIAVRQQADGVFGIDIYACGIAAAIDGGHRRGELAATNEVLRVYGLVRNILMSSINCNLQMPGVVGDKWPDEFELLSQPNEDLDKLKFERIACGRLLLAVSFNEFSPEYEGQPLERLDLGVKRKATGELYFTAQYP